MPNIIGWIDSATMYSLRPKQVDFDETWRSIESSIKKIINLQPLEHRIWDYNFSDIYSLCVAIPEPLSDRLYERTKACLEEHVSGLYKVISTTSEPDLLNEYCRLWRVYFQGTTYIHNLFGYLNKQYVKSKRHMEIEAGYGAYSQFITQSDVKEIGLLALDIWRQELIRPVETQLVNHLLSAISADREGKTTVPADVVRGVIMSFVQVDDIDGLREKNEKYPPSAVSNYETYRSLFEEKFLHATNDYYTIRSSKLISELDCSQYMEAVIACLADEDERSRRFLHKCSYEKVTRLCQDVMVSAHKERLHAVCHEMIQTFQKHDLHNMYTLLKPIPRGLAVVIREFESFVRKSGLDAISGLHGENVPHQFVENVLQVYEKFSAMVSDVFEGDGDFTGALDKALQAVVNYREEQKQSPKASERLARYTDMLLRKSAKGLSESEVDQKLSNAIIIFRYIEDKDVFQKFYSKMLATRLISNVSVSKDAEESMITKLKQACGFEFTSKLSRMFTDVGLSHELTDKFNAYCASNGVKLNVQMQSLVLQAGAWPLSAQLPTSSCSLPGGTSSEVPSVGFIVPPVLLPSVQEFERFYQTSHNGRKLTWLFNLATVEVKLNYLDKQYQVTMSVQQLAMLLCFESKNTLPLSYLATATGLTGELLVKNVRAIADSGILSVHDKDSLNGDSEVSLNFAMSSKRLRFKIVTPQMQRQVEKEAEHVNNTVQQDRKYYMECTIVRIMKTRKVLKHAALVNEVIEQTKCRFTPDVNFIKKNIEALIEKMYIQRTDQNDEYQYLA
uniref:Cullin-2 n=2 Tax=Parascaris univalens TaxID=6257 RepID=A0A915AFR3_PARUN